MKPSLAGAIAVWIAISAPPITSGSTPVVDAHNHEGLSVQDGAINISKLEDLKKRGIEIVMVPLPVERAKTADLPGRIEHEIEWLREAATTEPTFSLGDDPKELLSGVPENEIHILFSIEWFHELFGDDTSSIERYRDLGVRVIGLAEEDSDDLFGAAGSSDALSPFGRQIIAAMNRAGIIIDITHLNHAQKIEVITHSNAPVVASHSLVQSVVPSSFNLPDDVLTALADHNGAVWVSFQTDDLLGQSPDDQAVERLIDHIDVLVNRLGPDRVGIGTDLQAGGKYIPASLNQYDAFDRIRRRLEDRGYSKEAIEGILGGNVLRMLDAAAKTQSS